MPEQDGSVVVPTFTKTTKLELDFADELARSKRLSGELATAKAALSVAENQRSIAVAQLEQCLQDWRYAAKSFGQHDWMVRRFVELCKALRSVGIEVDDKL